MPFYDIITIGSATRDVFIIEKDFVRIRSRQFQTGVGQCFAFGSKIEVDRLVFDTGGGAANTAVTFSRLGLKTAAVAKVGDDENGSVVISSLKKEGVDIRFIIKDKKYPTAYSTILSGFHGDRTVLVFRGASGHLKPQEIPLKNLKSRWIYLTSLGGNLKSLKQILRFAKEKNIRVALNPGISELEHGKHLFPFLSSVDILLLNREEASALAQCLPNQLQEIFQTLCAWVKAVVAITDGKNGAYVSDGKRQYFSKAMGGEAKNALGAGDAFGSAFVAGLFLKNDISYALRLGILNSGSVVQHIGAKTGILKRLPGESRVRSVKMDVKLL